MKYKPKFKCEECENSSKSQYTAGKIYDIVKKNFDTEGWTDKREEFLNTIFIPLEEHKRLIEKIKEKDFYDIITTNLADMGICFCVDVTIEEFNGQIRDIINKELKSLTEGK